MTELRDAVNDSNLSAQIGYGEENNKHISSWRAEVSAFTHQLLRWIVETPFRYRISRAFPGQMVRDGEISHTGKIVRLSGDTYVISKDDGSFVIPNIQAGDKLEQISETV